MLTALVCKRAKGWVRIGLKVVPFIVIVAVAGLCLWLVLTFFLSARCSVKIAEDCMCVSFQNIYIHNIFFLWLSFVWSAALCACIYICVYIYISICVCFCGVTQNDVCGVFAE